MRHLIALGALLALGACGPGYVAAGYGPGVRPAPGYAYGPAAARIAADRREDIRDRREDIRDRREDIRDRREDIRDAQRYTGPADLREDIRDRREDIRDRREDVRDRREDIRDRRNGY